MVTQREIENVSAEIVRLFHPERIILFGSYAYGTPREDSDVDLLVVMPFEGRRFAAAADIANRIAPRFSLDLLLRTPHELRERIALNDFFLREISEKGRILYDAADQRVGDEGGRRLHQRASGTAGT